MIPEYYQEIRLPIAVNTLEVWPLCRANGRYRWLFAQCCGDMWLTHNRKNFEALGYPTISILESDVKRMVANAKLFNDKRSAIYEDAERVRKTASNFFTKHNPAYRDPTYQALATSVPERRMEGPR